MEVQEEEDKHKTTIPQENRVDAGSRWKYEQTIPVLLEFTGGGVSDFRNAAGSEL